MKIFNVEPDVGGNQILAGIQILGDKMMAITKGGCGFCDGTRAWETQNLQLTLLSECVKTTQVPWGDLTAELHS